MQGYLVLKRKTKHHLTLYKQAVGAILSGALHNVQSNENSVPYIYIYIYIHTYISYYVQMSLLYNMLIITIVLL